MGGNALKEYNVQRVSATEYVSRVERFDELMLKFHMDNPSVLFAYTIPTPLIGKESYGDLDVIYTCSPADRFTVLDAVEAALNPKGSITNDNTTSFEWEGFQVDVQYTPEYAYYWKHEWYKHGDLSALRGQVYNYYNFKLKDDGLYYVVRGKHNSKHIFITNSWTHATVALGYKLLSDKQVMTEEDTFEYTNSSEYCFLASATSKKPSKSRPTQIKFLEWIQNQPPKDTYPEDYGWTILSHQFGGKIYWQCRWEQIKLDFQDAVAPAKRKWRKFKWVTLYPAAFKVRGWL